MPDISEAQKARLFRALAVDLYKEIRDEESCEAVRKSDAYQTAEAQLSFLGYIDLVDD